MGDVIKKIGRVVSGGAPLLGLIPGVGPLAAGAIGAGGALVGGKNPFKAAISGGLGGLANKALLGGEGLAGITGNPMGTGADSGVFSGLERKIGKIFTSPNLLGTKEGKVDLGKTLGATAAATNIYGQNKQLQAQEKYNKANTAIRNRIMGDIFSGMNPSVYDKFSGGPGGY